MNASQIAQALVTGNFSDAEIRMMWSALKTANDRTVQSAKFQFAVGDKVKFRDRGGNPIEGEVIKVMQKNIRVRATTGMTWNVGATLLAKA